MILLIMVKPTIKILIILTTLTILSCKNKYYTENVLAEKILKSLQNNDFELFKKSVVSVEIYNNASDKKISSNEYDKLLTDMFIASQYEFQKLNIPINKLSIFKVNKPYKEYIYQNYKLIRFQAIFVYNNSYYKVNFSDCTETEEGYKLGESLGVEKY